MHDTNYVEFRKRLLRGGVAPKYVNRLIKELRHHHEDTVQAAQDAGLSSREAIAKSLANLGDQEIILKEAFDRPELRSWSYRWPWAIYGLGPVITFVALLVLIAFTMVGSIKLMQLVTDSRLVPDIGKTLIEFSWGGMMFVAPLLLAAITLAISTGRESKVLWPTVGVFLVIIFGCGINVVIRWPGAEVTDLGNLTINWGYGLFSPPWDVGGSILKTTRLVTTLVLVFPTVFFYKKYIRSRNVE